MRRLPPLLRPRILGGLAALGVAMSLLGGTGARAEAPPAAPRDLYARLIARSDAVVLGRVLEAGTRDVPAPGWNGELVTTVGFARIAVQRWIVGPDRDSILELATGDEQPIGPAWREAQQPGHSIILYLRRSLGRWVMVRELVGAEGRPQRGIELCTADDALARVPAILREAAISAPESLAARADLGVVVRLEDFTDDPPGIAGRVERLGFGTLPDSFLTVAETPANVLRRGRALLLLAARADGRWDLPDDGSGCYYLDSDRVAHSLDSLPVVLERMATAHARHAEGPRERARCAPAPTALPSGMMASTRATLDSIARHSGSLAHVLLPRIGAERGTVLPRDSVPAAVRADAVSWMRRVIRAEWLPDDLADIVYGLKDTRLWEPPEGDRSAVPIVGDYVVAEFAVGSDRFHVYDSGAELSIIVEPAAARSDLPDVTRLLRCWLRQFLAIPGDVQLPETLAVEQRGPLASAWVRSDRPAAHWWDGFQVATDRLFLFVRCTETRTFDEASRPDRLVAPGLPDRF